MKKLAFLTIFTIGFTHNVWADNIDILKNMFSNMAIKKDISVMPKY